MQLNKSVVYSANGFPKKFCEEIIQYSKEFNSVKAEVYDPNKEKNVDDIRRSELIWFQNEEWLFRKVFAFVKGANKEAGWNFDITRLEALQFTKYGHNQFYNWHTDHWSEPEKLENSLQRKISFVCNLSNPTDYVGGNLELHIPDSGPHQQPNIAKISQQKNFQQGSVVVFPSNLWHKVEPVTKGKRYSLVAWYIGRPFK